MSELEDLLKKHRKRIIDREEQTFRELLAAYDEIEKDLHRQYRALQKKILEAQKAGEKISPSWFYRKDRLKDLLKQTQDQIKRFGTNAAAIIEREQKAAIQIGISEAKDSITFEGAYSGKNLGTSLNTKAVETAAGLMGDGSPLLKYFEEQLAPQVAKAIRKEVISAAAQGTDFNTIARRLMKAGDITRQRALSTARTEVNRVRRSAALETYRENDDIEGWIWVASKSTRTCALCLAMDGTVMKLKEDFPQHVNCHCTVRAKLIGIEPRTRQTGQEYFNELSDEEKKKILGKNAFEAYKRGEVELKDFVAFKYDKRFGKSVTRKPLAQILSKKRIDESSRFASQLLRKAKKAEPKISKDIRSIGKSIGAKNPGFEDRFKTQESLARKLREKSAIQSTVRFTTTEDIARVNNDTLRYTYQLKNADYWKGIAEAKRQLRDAGYQIGRMWNAWDTSRIDTGYRGVNLTIKSSQGQIFELQFHTEASLKLSKDSHRLYEEERNLKTTGKRRAEIRAE